MRCFLSKIVRFLAASTLALTASTAIARVIESTLGDRLVGSDSQWTLIEPQESQVQRFHIPVQLPEIERLPADRRSRVNSLIQQHNLNTRFVREAIKATRGAVRGGLMHSKPEYLSRLREIIIGIDRRAAEPRNALAAHEPILKALPAYTRITILLPDELLATVKDNIDHLGLSNRTRFVPTHIPAEDRASTHWVRDMFLLSEGAGRQTVFRPLSYRPRRDLASGDLKHLNVLRSTKRSVVTAPLFYRAGNLLLGVSRKRTLFVGEKELTDNATVFEYTVGRVPPTDEVLKVFAAITGADDVRLMPNTRHLFHIDMYMSFLDDKVVALLDPVDPEALSLDDLMLLQKARSILSEEGYQIVPIPSLAARITHFQSSTNIVPFRHRDTGRKMALVPNFPDQMIRRNGQTISLNTLVEEAYRSAGVTPIFVEDRFFRTEGNTHCAVVPLK